MAKGQHPPSCAKRIRVRAAEEGWRLGQTVNAIRDHCGVSALKAHRLGRGWTLAKAVEEFLATLGDDPHRPRLNEDQLNAWENGRGRPRADTIDLLCRFYRTGPVQLGFATDYGDKPDTDEVADEPKESATREKGQEPSITQEVVVGRSSGRTGSGRAVLEAGGPDIEEDDVRRRRLLRQVLAGAGVSLSSPVMQMVEAIRMRMDDSLEATTVSPAKLDRLEEAAAQHGYAFKTTPALTLLCEVLLDFAEVQQHLERKQITEHQRRLNYAAARLGALTGNLLTDLGDHREARNWFATARTAADETGDRGIRSWVRAREAMLALYHGRPPQIAAELAASASAIAGGTVCVAGALAPAIEARAHARMGNPAATTEALRRAQSAFAKLTNSHLANSVYGYPEKQFRFHEGSAWTSIRNTGAARAAHRRALDLHPAEEHVIPTLVRIDQATCLVHDGELVGGFASAGTALLSSPAAYRTPLVISRAWEMLDVVPAKHSDHRAVREYRDVLAVAAKAA